MDLVWRKSQHKGSELLVLLAIADNANEQTGLAHPSQELLAAKTRLSRRGVQKILPKLLAAGELVLVEKATSHAAARYSIEANRVRRNVDVLEQFTANTSAQLRRTACSPGLEVGQEVEIEANASISVAETDTAEQRIFDHWQQQRRKPRARFTANRRKKIQARLKDFTEPDLFRAIDGVAFDPWNDRHLHDDLTVIFRNAEQVEKFLALADDPPARKGGLSVEEIWNYNQGEEAA
jgi:hypothetical protein